jgi:heme/copper-type cytochrome/quinol oxidase subunit 2
MTPNQIVVGEGDRVKLEITSDSPAELHVHGYDLEQEVEPGEPAELTFDATITGRFEIEDHDTETTLGELIVQPR